MSDRIEDDERLVRALRMTREPPQAWIDAAALIPATLGALESIEQLIASSAFRSRFAESPESAVAEAGLSTSPALLGALRAEFA
jgi:hypothetical protein